MRPVIAALAPALALALGLNLAVAAAHRRAARTFKETAAMTEKTVETRLFAGPQDGATVRVTEPLTEFLYLPNADTALVAGELVSEPSDDRPFCYRLTETGTYVYTPQGA